MAMRKWESCKLSCRIFPKSMNNILNIYNSRHSVVFKFDEENIPAVPILLKFSLWKLLKILSSSTWKNNLFTGPAEAVGFNYRLKLFLRMMTEARGSVARGKCVRRNKFSNFIHGKTFMSCHVLQKKHWHSVLVCSTNTECQGGQSWLHVKACKFLHCCMRVSHPVGLQYSLHLLVHCLRGNLCCKEKE